MTGGNMWRKTTVIAMLIGPSSRNALDYVPTEVMAYVHPSLDGLAIIIRPGEVAAVPFALTHVASGAYITQYCWLGSAMMPAMNHAGNVDWRLPGGELKEDESARFAWSLLESDSNMECEGCYACYAQFASERSGSSERNLWPPGFADLAGSC